MRYHCLKGFGRATPGGRTHATWPHWPWRLPSAPRSRQKCFAGNNRYSQALEIFFNAETAARRPGLTFLPSNLAKTSTRKFGCIPSRWKLDWILLSGYWQITGKPEVKFQLPTARQVDVSDEPLAA